MAAKAKKLTAGVRRTQKLPEISTVQQGLVTEADMRREVVTLLEGSRWKMLERGKGSRRFSGDILAERTDLGWERRYAIECVLEINNAKIHDHYSRLKNFIRQSKQPFAEFDELWLVGYAYADEPMRKRPENDRHFRVLDLNELRSLLAPPPSRKPQGKARTKIGKAVEANKQSIEIAIAALMLQIQDKIESLRRERKNSDESIAAVQGQIADLESMRSQLADIKTAVAQFVKGNAKEKDVVKSVTTFGDTLKSWWTKSHEKICDSAATGALFVGSAGLLHLMSADNGIALAIAGAIFGGETVVKGLKALPRKLFDIVR